MMCYRDTTFCQFKTCKKFRRCPLALTKKVEDAAAEWWTSGNAPIATFSEAPACWEGK